MTNQLPLSKYLPQLRRESPLLPAVGETPQKIWAGVCENVEWLSPHSTPAMLRQDKHT